MSASANSAARVFAYHERTKHHFNRHARAPGIMDWATQPDPFRTYDGAPRFELPLSADHLQTRYCDLYADGAVAPYPFGMDSLAAFFELALGLTAWKEYGGTRWALRSDPSSGNLHPTEGYVVLPETAGLPAGVYHYVSRDHCLEQRCRLDGDPALKLRERLPARGFIVGISSIHWREAWKYGERAFRYCQHDTGHVIATARYAAAALGWSALLLDGLGDVLVARMLGLDRDEDFASVAALDREHPDVALLVAPRGDASPSELERSASEAAELLSAGTWAGKANALSSAHVEWDVIGDVAEATCKPPSRSAPPTAPPDLAPLRPPCEVRAATIIRQRRSAVALDGVTSISRQQFYSMLDALLPRPSVPPWDAIPWQPRIHLGIFVHRVEGLDPGLYLLERTAEVHEHFEAILKGEARWTRPPGCPEHLRLFCIRTADLRQTAATVSCRQDIAADGAFSLGMIAEFREPILSGAFWYRRLFWEAGVLGQVLYLEAEAAGVRATGIGCYFDDAFHEVLGLSDERFQSLYHFTLGGFVEDLRLATLPPYEHLDSSRRRASKPLLQR